MSEREQLTSRDHAHRLRALGLSVLPVPRPRPGARPGQPGDGKVPTIAWTTYQTRLPTSDEIDQWFAAPMNLAIVTGAISGVVVVDCDSAEALAWVHERLPYTCWQTKTPRGYHLFYRHPELPVRNRARLETGSGRLELDVRGDGGYVIAPGSVHATGAIYEAKGDWTVPRDRLPEFWPEWIAPPDLQQSPASAPPRRPTDLVNGRAQPRFGLDVTDRARRYLAAIPRPEIGQGSDAAVWYAACRLVKGFALSTAEAEALLWEWAGGRPGWTREWIAKKVQHADKDSTEAIGALR